MSIHHYDPCKTLALACALAASEARRARGPATVQPLGHKGPGDTDRPPALIAWIGNRLAGFMATAQGASNV